MSKHKYHSFIIHHSFIHSSFIHSFIIHPQIQSTTKT